LQIQTISFSDLVKLGEKDLDVSDPLSERGKS
jgi:hypothetical protein